MKLSPVDIAPRIRRFVLPWIFVAILFVPLVQMATRIFPDREFAENRKPAGLPRLPGTGFGEFKRFCQEFEAYFNDHFGLRNRLVQLHALVTFRLLRKSPRGDVVVGKDGWLFYNCDGDRNSLSNFRGLANFPNAELAKIETNLELLKRGFAARKILFLVVLAADKEAIYPEMLPDAILAARGSSTRADQIVSMLRRLRIPFVDMRNELLEKKSKSPQLLYHLTDTHWNHLGAFFGYAKIMNTLRQAGAQVPAVDPWDMTLTVQQNNGAGDLARMVKMDGSLLDYDCRPVRPSPARANLSKAESGEKSFIYSVSDRGLPGLLVFMDSFSLTLMPYLSEHFSRSHYLWQYDVDFGIVDREKPDVVILEIIERDSHALTHLKITAHES